MAEKRSSAECSSCVVCSASIVIGWNRNLKQVASQPRPEHEQPLELIKLAHAKNSDNVIIERFWTSVKHERTLLQEYNTLPELEALLHDWFDRYNQWRPHIANRPGKPIEQSRRN